MDSTLNTINRYRNSNTFKVKLINNNSFVAILSVSFYRRKHKENRKASVLSTEEKVMTEDIPLNTSIIIPSMLLNSANKSIDRTRVNKEAVAVPSKYIKPIKLEDLEDYVKTSIEDAELEKQHEVIYL